MWISKLELALYLAERKATFFNLNGIKAQLEYILRNEKRRKNSFYCEAMTFLPLNIQIIESFNQRREFHDENILLFDKNIKHEYSVNGEIYFVTLQAAGNDYCNAYKTYSNITASYNEASNIHTPKHEKREYWVT